ncbi:MAG TPA: RNA polymerase sigma factor SigF, partial [Marmoricola sp.]|nr:RNA polymerase sigma factor SigF [Marmoricola sp.]
MTDHSGDVSSTTRERSRALFAQLATTHSSSIDRARARGELVELHLPLVEHCARRFANRGEPLEDLVQVGTIGLIKAVDRFDSERGVEFSTYATPTILGEIKRHFRDKGWAIRVPRRLQELRMSIASATNELSQQLGRSPTPHELAERLHVEVEDVLDGIESANAYATLSLDAGESSEDGLGSMLDTMGALDEALHHVEIRESIRPFIEALPPRQKQILLLRFFRQMTQSQIAQEVGISQMHVSRLLARTLAELRDSIH